MAVSGTVTPNGGSNRVVDLAAMRQASRAAVQEYFAIKQRFASPDPQIRPVGVEVDRLKQRLDEIPREYVASLPMTVFSRCPFCHTALAGPFDLWGFDGFWWSPKLHSETWGAKGCEHFRLLLGAVQLQGQPLGANFEAQLGPDTPYVVRRLLSLPTMIAVVHSIPMELGHRTFPIAYFSTETPPSGQLAQGWIEESYCYTDPTGRPAWTVTDDPWDFELAPWIARRQLRWTVPGSSDATISDHVAEQFPYSNPDALRRPQFVKNARVRHGTVPTGSTPDPFD